MLDSDTIIPLRKRERKTREGNGLWGREKYNRKKKKALSAEKRAQNIKMYSIPTYVAPS